MIRKQIRLKLVFLLLLVVIFTACSSNNAINKKDNTMSDDIIVDFISPFQINSGFRKVLDNDNFELLFDESTAEIALHDKNSGVIRYSNPQDRAEDRFAGLNIKDTLSSQLSLTYYDDSKNVITMNSFTDSVQKGQYKIEEKSGSLKVIYTFGCFERDINSIPEKMSKERFEKFFFNDNIDEDAQAEMKKRFSYSEEDKIYIRRQLQEFMIEYIIEIMDMAGYTEEDLKHDSEENGFELTATAQPKFQVPIIYKLDEQGLIVNIPANEIKYESKYKLCTLNVLQYFGSHRGLKEGYIFVPDGSGGLMDTSVDSGKFGVYSAPVYGEDYVNASREKIDYGEQIFMPVFGIKSEDGGVFAVIEKGDAIATIRASKSYIQTEYNEVSASFELTSSSFTSLSETNRERRIPLFQDKPYSGDITLHYYILDRDNSDYSSMAGIYRSYLEKTGILTMKKPQGDIPLYIKLLGGVQINKTVFAIPVTTCEPLTTFSDAEKILSELRAAGLQNINVQYSGWFNGGLKQEYIRDLNIESKLGGKKGFKSLSEYATINNIGFFPEVQFMTIPKGSKGFSYFGNAARRIDGTVAGFYTYDPATFLSRSWQEKYILSMDKFSSAVKGFIGKYSKLNPNGIALGDLGWFLSSDFDRKKLVNRQQAMGKIADSVNEMKSLYNEMLFDKANFPLMQYADHIVNVPYQSSNYECIDVSVPFYQMVIHGYIRYAGKPANLSGDVRLEFLRCLETGSSLQFVWLYRDASILKETEFSYYFSTSYENWKGEAVNYYNLLNRELSGVGDNRLVKHEWLQNKVCRVMYENGTSFTINYSKAPVNIDGATIEGLSYIRSEGVMK